MEIDESLDSRRQRLKDRWTCLEAVSSPGVLFQQQLSGYPLSMKAVYKMRRVFDSPKVRH